MILGAMLPLGASYPLSGPTYNPAKIIPPIIPYAIVRPPKGGRGVGSIIPLCATRILPLFFAQLASTESMPEVAL